MIGKKLTVFVSSKAGDFKEIHISASKIRYGLTGLGILGLLLCVFAVDYFFAFSSRLDYQKYQSENKSLKSQLFQTHLKMEKLNSRLRQIEDFSYKIKVIAGLEKPTSSLIAMGPLSGSSFPDLSSSGFPAKKPKSSFRDKASISSSSSSQTLSPLSAESLVIYMDHLDKKSRLAHQNITLIMEQLYERKDIISSTPSILPVKGWISSHFGYRQYPFTGEVSLHEGMDIAAFPGTPIYAPANGVVVFAGYKKGYGKVIVVDHGYELSTLYGHLSDIMVSRWQKVERKQVIGAIGNTGNSSGPHLHYEVRISNVPVDPANYILNQTSFELSEHTEDHSSSKKDKWATENTHHHHRDINSL